MVVYFDVWLCPYHHWQEHLVKQGMKADQAASLVEMTAAKCSTVKYDVELAEEYIARQVIFTMLSLLTCVFINVQTKFWLQLSFFDDLILLQISTFSSVDPNVIAPLHQLPSLQAIYTLDAVISKVQVSLDEHLSKVAIEADTHKSSEITKNLLPATLQLTDVYTAFTRWERYHSNLCTPTPNIEHQTSTSISCILYSKLVYEDMIEIAAGFVYLLHYLYR